jgi:hypothetical protein
MRHKDVSQCAVGAFFQYLAMRFERTGEMAEAPDFSVNRDWFDIKYLVSMKQNRKSESDRDFKTAIGNQSYAEGLKKVLSSLGLDSRHFVHIGRVVGSVELEMQEVDEWAIKYLGNWDNDTRQMRYSSKLPMKALRAMSG